MRIVKVLAPAIAIVLFAAPIDASVTSSSIYTRSAVAYPLVDNYAGKTEANAELSWGESYSMQGLVNYFKLTKNLSYLDTLIEHADRVFAVRDDRRVGGTGNPVWSSTTYTNGVPFAGIVATGMITYPIAEFAYLAIKDQDLGRQIYPETGETYGMIAARYVSLVEQSVRYHDYEWSSSLSRYVPQQSTASYFRDSQGRPAANAGTYPYNMQTAIGRTYAFLYLATGKTEHYNRARALASYLDSALYSQGNTLVWKYWGWVEDPSIEDISHGALSADFMGIMYHHGLYFSYGQLEQLRNTFHTNLYVNSNTTNQVINGTGPSSETTETAFASMWATLGFLDFSIVQKARSAYRKTGSGSYGWYYLGKSLMDRFTNAKQYRATCSRDFECSSNICFAGRVCGNLLGNSGTCTRDVECVSKICFAGRVCAEPLGYGSTCTRDLECTSNICFAGKVCGNPLGTGSSCYRNNECVSNICSSGACQ